MKFEIAKLRWEVFLRISVAIFAILRFSTLILDYDLFFSCNSLINHDITSLYSNNLVPSLYKIRTFFNFDDCSDFINYALITSYFVSLIFLLFGFLTKPATLFALFLTLIFNSTFDLFVYGVDFYLVICLFYLLVIDSTAMLSLDNFVFSKWIKYFDMNNQSAFYLRIFQVHLSIAYFFGGFDKLIGTNWRNGESIWKALHLVECPNLIKVELISTSPLLYTLLGWSVIIFEILYPIFANFEKTRKYWILGIISMHLGIGIFLGLFFFSTMMIILNISLFLIPYLNKSS